MSEPSPWAMAAWLGALCLAGCSSDELFPGHDFERMLEQAHELPYAETDLFGDGRVLRTPPDGTVARDEVVGQPALTEGVVDGQYVTRFPLSLTPGLLQRGRDRFERLCGACHGVLGDGGSRVALTMSLRKPPSLLAGPRAFPVGRLYQIVTVGYGLMGSLADDLGVEDRWAVVAYLRALQLSQGGLAESALTPAERARAQEVLR